MKHIKELDALRGIAVLLVILAHYIDQRNFINRLLPNGFIGVTLFFVLSGFLITNILINNKKKIDSAKAAIGDCLRTFYIRRSFRIFPAYYLLIIVTMWLPVFKFWQQGGPWHIFYLSNFYFYFYNLFQGAYGIFWSLSVEEQFYLFWPSIILFTNRKHYLKIFFLLALLSPVFRYFITSPTNYYGRFLLPGSLDSFCIGAFLSYCYFYRNSGIGKFMAANKNALLWLSLPLFVGIHLFDVQHHLDSSLHMGLYFFLLSLVLGVWVWIVAEGVSFKPLKSILNNTFLLYTGRISYGIYLYQNFMPEIHIMFPHSFMYVSIYLNMLVRLAILYGVASLSFFLLEKPVLKLKEKFTY